MSIIEYITLSWRMIIAVINCAATVLIVNSSNGPYFFIESNKSPPDTYSSTKSYNIVNRVK